MTTNKDKLLQLCVVYNCQVFKIDTGYVVISPKELNEELKGRFIELYPDVDWEFVLGPKKLTIDHIAYELGISGIMITATDNNHRNLVLKASKEGTLNSDIISRLLENDGFYDTATITFEDRILFYYNRYLKTTEAPTRDTSIGKDDLLNLQIALESSKSIEEFLQQV